MTRTHARTQSVPSLSAPGQVRVDVGLYIPRHRGGLRQVRDRVDE